jgi:OmpA-OmpF porin, OOP family
MRRIALVLLGVLCAACPGPRERVTVLDVDPGGALRVTTAQGTTTLTTPGTTVVHKDGRVAQGTRSTEALQAQHDAVLATLPAPPATYTIHFATGQTTPTAEGQATLSALLADVPRRDVVDIQVTGHTDQQGTAASNERLAVARAVAVQALLVQGGVPAAAVRVTAKGEREPLVDAPGQAEARNRRVEVRVR